MIDDMLYLVVIVPVVLLGLMITYVFADSFNSGMTNATNSFGIDNSLLNNNTSRFGPSWDNGLFIAFVV